MNSTVLEHTKSLSLVSGTFEIEYASFLTFQLSSPRIAPEIPKVLYAASEHGEMHGWR